MSAGGSARRPRGLRGRCRVPGDKAISHRAAIMAAIADGRSVISGFSPAGDCAATLAAVGALGAAVTAAVGMVQVDGIGSANGAQPAALDCGRSGTTMRLLAGVAAGIGGSITLTGDPQLLRRPMERVAVPLRLMGAEITTAAGGRPPLLVRGGGLCGIHFRSPVASAQVKSAVLLAALGAAGPTRVAEPVATRDHTERLLAAMGADVRVDRVGGEAHVALRPSRLHPLEVQVPGDASSAAVLAAAAALVPNSAIEIVGVCANPTRLGFLDTVRRMGGVVELAPQPSTAGGEPVATILVRHSPLQAVVVTAADVPSMVDELPLLGLLATQADGATEVRGAAELRVKESDRIRGLVRGLRALGATAEELDDGFVVVGPTPLHGGHCDSLTDHRLAMTFVLAGLIADGPVTVSDLEFVDDSFPGFLEELRALM